MPQLELTPTLGGWVTRARSLARRGTHCGRRAGAARAHATRGTGGGDKKGGAHRPPWQEICHTVDGQRVSLRTPVSADMPLHSPARGWAQFQFARGT